MHTVVTVDGVIAVAMGVGYLSAKRHLEFMTPSPLTVQNMEQNGILASLSRSVWLLACTSPPPPPRLIVLASLYF